MNTARFSANRTKGRFYEIEVNQRLNDLKALEIAKEVNKDKPVKYDLKRWAKH